MPAVSKKQFRLMAAEAHGKGNLIKGLSDVQVKEFIQKNVGKKSYKNLPEKSKGKKY